MKLFTKTLLFFIGVIAFQSVLTTAIVSRITSRADLADAQRDLEGEAAILFDSFNSWKRQLWISLMGLRADPRFLNLLSTLQSGALDAGSRRVLQETAMIARADCIALRRGAPFGVELVPAGYGTLGLADFRGLAREKPGSYIDFKILGGTLCMIGVTRVEGSGVGADVFLLKRIDPEFCGQLTLNRKSLAAVFAGTRCLTGSIPVELSEALAPAGETQGAYSESYNRKAGSARYNVAAQWTGRLYPASGAGGREESAGEDLFLLTFISNDPFIQRTFQVTSALLMVSVACALITIVLSLFLSRNITHPIDDLLAAMERLRTGRYDDRLAPRGGHEIRRLFKGFDSMALELTQSRAAMQEHVRETLLLKEYNEKIVNSIGAGIAIIGPGLVLENANRAFRDAFAVDAGRVSGARLDELGIDIVDESVKSAIAEVLSADREEFSKITRGRGGRVFELKLYPFLHPHGCVLQVEDVTARTELQHKIFQAEKLSTVSMLSAGMAHEINNPLGSILTNVQNLIADEEAGEAGVPATTGNGGTPGEVRPPGEHRGGPDSEAHAPGAHRDSRIVSLKWIEQETRRIARIVRELLNFSSPEAGHEHGADVNAVVEDAARLLGYSLTRETQVRIDTRLARGLPPTAVSPDELKQVVINLVKNSVEAVAGRGRILVCTRRAAAGGIALSVSDSGAGIPASLIPRIFDPFFTTKGNGTGTGLGLSVVYGIVTKYGGSIGVKSREGRGTRIVVVLPEEGAKR